MVVLANLQGTKKFVPPIKMYIFANFFVMYFFVIILLYIVVICPIINCSNNLVLLLKL